MGTGTLEKCVDGTQWPFIPTSIGFDKAASWLRSNIWIKSKVWPFLVCIFLFLFRIQATIQYKPEYGVYCGWNPDYYHNSYLSTYMIYTRPLQVMGMHASKIITYRDV